MDRLNPSARRLQLQRRSATQRRAQLERTDHSPEEDPPSQSGSQGSSWQRGLSGSRDIQLPPDTPVAMVRDLASQVMGNTSTQSTERNARWGLPQGQGR